MTRRLGTAALALQGFFVAAWLVGGALQPGYSASESFISELAAKDAAHPWLVTLGIAAAGLSFLALGAALRGAAAAAFAVAGLAFLLAAVMPLDCALTTDPSCRAAARAGELSWTTNAHLVAAGVAQVALTATPFALGMVRVGLAGVAITFLVTALQWSDAGVAGGAQRAYMLLVFAWVAVVARPMRASTSRSRSISSGGPSTVNS